jgi:methylmalonyl-CoA mutase N-terminal domain/subunit
VQQIQIEVVSAETAEASLASTRVIVGVNKYRLENEDQSGEDEVDILTWDGLDTPSCISDFRLGRLAVHHDQSTVLRSLGRWRGIDVVARVRSPRAAALATLMPALVTAAEVEWYLNEAIFRRKAST